MKSIFYFYTLACLKLYNTTTKRRLLIGYWESQQDENVSLSKILTYC